MVGTTTSISTSITTTTTTISSFMFFFSRNNNNNSNHNHRHYPLVVRSGGGRRRRNNVPLSKHQQQDSASARFLSSKSKNPLSSSSSSHVTQSQRERERIREMEFLWRPTTTTTSSRCKTRRRNTLREKLLLLPTQKTKDQDAHHVYIVGVDAKDAELAGRSPDAEKNSAIEEDEGIQELLEASPIGKYVRFGPKTCLIDTLPIMRGMTSSSLKALPSAGANMVLLCTFCILGAMSKLFAVNGKVVELNRDEVDMLMRKKKSRMDKEKSDIGSVAVVQNVPSPLVASDARPHLDRNKLMNCIEIAVKSQPNLVLPGSPCHCSPEDCDIGTKLSAAIIMSAPVWGLEWHDSAQNDEGRTGDDLASPVRASNDHTVAMKADGHETDAFGSLKNIPSFAENNTRGSNSNTPINLNASRNEGIEQNVIGAIDFIQKGSSYTASGTSSSIKHTHKILKLVQKDKEYLLEKHGIAADKLYTRQEVQLKGLEVGASAHACSSNDKFNVTISTSNNESIKTIDQSKFDTPTIYGDVDPVSLIKKSSAKNVPETIFHAAGMGNPMLLMAIDGNKVTVKNNLDLPHDVPTGIPEKLSTASVVAPTPIVEDLITGNMEYPSRSLPGIINAENTCSKTIRSKSFNVEQRSIGNQSGRDNNTNFLYTYNTRHGLESQGFSYIDSSSVAHSVGGRRGMGDNVADNSKQLTNSLGGYADSEDQAKPFQDTFVACNATSNRRKGNEGWKVAVESEKANSADLELAVRSLKEHRLNKVEFDANASQLCPIKDDKSVGVRPLILDSAQGSGEKPDIKGLTGSTKSIQLDSAGPGYASETLKIDSNGNWIEDNFQKFDPIIKAVGIGFRENYVLAKEKVQQSVISAKISELSLLGEDDELEWMTDEKLKEIVFQVRDNELAGRDPFHLMDAVDQEAFFKGLELKVDKVNEKLLSLHEWIHSRIGNLDYGADGISLDDPREKIVPFWKGPTVDKELESVHKFTKLQKMNFSRNVRQSHTVKAQTHHGLLKSEKSPNSKDVSLSLNSSVNKGSLSEVSTSERTLIECSDGSKRAGKKMGKEHWQHTKKWSRGFLEVYNAETDPEIKSMMTDMGKDLDRWITEKEIQEAADVLTSMPKSKQRYIQKKMDKLKREVEMYGSQAVISKYIEYSDEKEEDYLWWLDLQFVLCIELYTVDDGVQKIGFYSLEMVTELELQPAQYNVIAFEDPGDSKNLCYIIQAHMDMIGSGRAFVVARPPKDAFREAKANGFNVTVIKKGELTLNVDQTLDEVEENITEIGSKIYHDKVMKDRGVDIRTLMNGVVHADKAARRKPKGMLMRAGKS